MGSYTRQGMAARAQEWVQGGRRRLTGPGSRKDSFRVGWIGKLLFGRPIHSQRRNGKDMKKKGVTRDFPRCHSRRKGEKERKKKDRVPRAGVLGTPPRHSAWMEFSSKVGRYVITQRGRSV